MEVFGVPITTLFIMVFIAFVVGIVLMKIFKFALKTAIIAALVVLGLFLASQLLEIF